MKTIGQFLALAVFAVIAPSCVGSADDSESEALSAAERFPECHAMDLKLRGRGATIWKVKNALDLVAVQIDSDIVCVDTVEQTLDIGIIAIPPIAWPTNDDGATRDGSPIPAEKWNRVARMRGRYPIDF